MLLVAAHELRKATPTFVVDGRTITSAPIGFSLELGPGWSLEDHPGAQIFATDSTGTALWGDASISSENPLTIANAQKMLSDAHFEDVSAKEFDACLLGSVPARCAELTFTKQGVPMYLKVITAQKGQLSGGRTYQVVLFCQGRAGTESACDAVLSGVVLPH
jgi:hypothetical protein